MAAAELVANALGGVGPHAGGSHVVAAEGTGVRPDLFRSGELHYATANLYAAVHCSPLEVAHPDRHAGNRIPKAVAFRGAERDGVFRVRHHLTFCYHLDVGPIALSHMVLERRAHQTRRLRDVSGHRTLKIRREEKKISRFGKRRMIVVIPADRGAEADPVSTDAFLHRRADA